MGTWTRIEKLHPDVAEVINDPTEWGMLEVNRRITNKPYFNLRCNESFGNLADNWDFDLCMFEFRKAIKSSFGPQPVYTCQHMGGMEEDIESIIIIDGKQFYGGVMFILNKDL